MATDHEIWELPDGFKLDVTGRRLWAGDEEIELGEHDFKLLVYFVHHPESVLEKSELKEAVWGDKKVSDDSLVASIRKIRTALDNKHIIENRHGFGYIFKATPVRQAKPGQNSLSAPISLPTLDVVEMDKQIPITTSGDQTISENGTLSEPERESAPVLSGTSNDNTSSDLPVRQEYGRAHQSDPSEPSREFIEANFSIMADEFSFIVYLLVGILTVFMLGFAFAPQWHSTERLAYLETTLILGGIVYNLRRIYLFWKSGLVNDHAYYAVQQFQIFWTLLLVSWLCLYGVWLLMAASYSFPVVATLLNNSNSLMLVLCYFVLNERTVSKDQNGDGVSDQPLFGLKTIILAVVVLVVAVVEKLALFESPDTDNTSYILTLFDLGSGLGGGIAMGLFISRLHSRLLGESTLLPIVGLILYLYAAIQPFYFIVNQAAEIPPGLPAPWPMVLSLRPGIIGLALILKLIMFLYVTQIIRRDRLLFYMINAKRIYSEVELQWKAFRPAVKWNG